MSRNPRRRGALPNPSPAPISAALTPTTADGKAAAPMLPSTPGFVNLSSQLVSSRRGTKELLEAYKDSPWLRAITGKIARATAGVEWMVMAKRSKANGKKTYVKSDGHAYHRRGNIRDGMFRQALDNAELETFEEHPLLDLLRGGTGNSRLLGFGVFAVTQVHLDLAGEAFWLKERDAQGMPIAVWPLPPVWVRSMPVADDPYYQIALGSGKIVKVPVTEVIAFIEPDPANPYTRGTGIASSLGDELQIDEYAAKHQKSFFLNRARPDLIISGQYISPADAKRLEVQWLQDHQGFWKSFKPLFFSQKIDIKELTQSFESMQMVQIRKAERDTFISVFGAPPEKFGIIGESKRSTIQAADYFWTKDLIEPRLEFIRRVLQFDLVPDFDERIILGYDSPVIQDEEMKHALLKTFPWTITINEIRKEMGLPSLGTAGDVLVMPMNMQVLPAKNPQGGAATQEEMINANRAATSNAVVKDAPLDAAALASSVAEEVVNRMSPAFDHSLDKRILKQN